MYDGCSSPQSTHVSTCPPSAAVRHSCASRRAWRCSFVSGRLAATAGPCSRKMSATRNRGRHDAVRAAPCSTRCSQSVSMVGYARSLRSSCIRAMIGSMCFLSGFRPRDIAAAGTGGRWTAGGANLWKSMCRNYAERRLAALPPEARGAAQRLRTIDIMSTISTGCTAARPGHEIGTFWHADQGQLRLRILKAVHPAYARYRLVFLTHADIWKLRCAAAGAIPCRRFL